jgi:hypothetical protein
MRGVGKAAVATSHLRQYQNMSIRGKRKFALRAEIRLQLSQDRD